MFFKADLLLLPFGIVAASEGAPPGSTGRNSTTAESCVVEPSGCGTTFWFFFVASAAAQRVASSVLTRVARASAGFFPASDFPSSARCEVATPPAALGRAGEL